MLLHRYLDHPGVRLTSTFLDNATYAKALDALIIVCADVIFTLQGTRQVLLAQRVNHPGKGPWIIGGRVYRGETLEESIRRHTVADCGLDFSLARFTFLQMHEFLHQPRQQPPTENGSHVLSFTFHVDLSEEERQYASAHLRPTEYDPAAGLVAYEEADLRAAQAPEMVIDLYRKLFSS